jgi:NADPH2:quinone reductase
VRGWQIRQPDGPSAVALAELPDLVDPAALVVGVRAAGVGFPDLLMSWGKFQVRQPTPFTLGWEGAGEVVSAPANSYFAVGDRVMTLSFGCYAEQVAAVPETTFALPDALSYEQGAALPLNYLTAIAGLQRRGGLQDGETVLVQGAAGGAGTAAVQVARALGARVFAVVSSEEKADVARAAGAEEVFLISADWRAAVIEASDGGVNLVYDPVGGSRFTDCLRCLASEGRLIVIGFAAGEIPEVAVNRLLLKNIDVRGCTWSVLANAPDGLRQAASELGAMAEAGAIRPPVGATFPFAQAREALQTVEQRHSLGKTVLTVSP